jgi:Zn-dependent protease with chaperone function
LGQVMQPAFYYATLTMLIALVSSLLLIRINHTLSFRWKSIMIVIPLVLSLAVVLWLSPTLIGDLPPGSGQTNFFQLTDGSSFPGLEFMDPFLSQVVPLNDDFLSISGTIVAIGLILGALSLTFSVLVGDRLARRLLRVVELSLVDFPELWADVADLAAALNIKVPKLGLVEDLRPNAFTFGRGRGTTVVFSLGILELLDRQELRAVAAHELSHVKNHDVWFRTAIRALSWVQFFNPASHLAVRAAQREREKLADETARSVLEEKGSLLRAIEKVTSFLGTSSTKASLVTRLSLCFTLSFSDRSSLMSDHPSLADRARSFADGLESGPLSSRTCLVLSIAVLLATAVLLSGLGEVRSEILHLEMQGVVDAMPVFDHHMEFRPLGNVSGLTDINMTAPAILPGMHMPINHPLEETMII